MPKLPDNLVKPPVFDNPLRRTTPAPSTALTSKPSTATGPANDESGNDERLQVIPISSGVVTDNRTSIETDEASTPHRITLRIDDATRRALETECYRRRVAGEKTNLAEIARNILARWAGGAS